MTRKTFLIAFALLIVGINAALYGWVFLLEDQAPKVEETTSFTDVIINQMEFDNQGRIWILTDNDLRLYEGEKLVNVFTEKDSPALANLGDGELYGGILTINFDNQGSLWVVDSGLIGVYKEGNWSETVVEVPAGPFLETFEFDKQGRLWAGFGDELRIFDGGESTSYMPENSDFAGGKISRIAFDAQNRAWLSTDMGISIFDGESWEFLDPENSELPWDHIGYISFDDQGRAWIEVGNGISVFDGKTWARYSYPSLGIQNGSVVETILVDNRSWVWIAFENEGVVVFDGENWRYDFVPGHLKFQSITRDHVGNVWIYNESSVYKTKSEVPESVPYSTALLGYFIEAGAPIYLTILLVGVWLFVKSGAENRIGWIFCGFAVYVVWLFFNLPNPLPLRSIDRFGPFFLGLNPGTFGTIGSIISEMYKGKKHKGAGIVPAGMGLIIGAGASFCLIAFYLLLIRDFI